MKNKFCVCKHFTNCRVLPTLLLVSKPDGDPIVYSILRPTLSHQLWREMELASFNRCVPETQRASGLSRDSQEVVEAGQEPRSLDPKCLVPSTLQLRA